MVLTRRRATIRNRRAARAHCRPRLHRRGERRRAMRRSQDDHRRRRRVDPKLGSNPRAKGDQSGPPFRSQPVSCRMMWSEKSCNFSASCSKPQTSI